MSHFLKSLLLILLVFTFAQCKNESTIKKVKVSKNEVKYAKGFSILNHKGYSVVTVSNPWPKADKTYTYILKQKN
jgi:iron complex transport system substrate-binding protein